MTNEQKNVLRDAGVFAFKLWLDGVKDFALAVLGLGAAALDIIIGRGTTGYFYRIMRFGERVDQVLNLYGPLELPGTTRAEPPAPEVARDS